jgi:hypothetical protein
MADNWVGNKAGASTSQEISAQTVARNVTNAGSRTILPRPAVESQAVWVQRQRQATLAREPSGRSRKAPRAETRSSTRLEHNNP